MICPVNITLFPFMQLTEIGEAGQHGPLAVSHVEMEQFQEPELVMILPRNMVEIHVSTRRHLSRLCHALSDIVQVGQADIPQI